MPIITRNDEQIQVGTTPGLVAGLSYFVFDGTFGKPDYRGFDLLIFEYAGRQPMIKDLDYSWDYVTGLFNLLQAPFGVQEVFQAAQWYTVQFQNPLPAPIIIVPANLIDWSYFIRDITIPNIDPTNERNAANYERINMFIQKYEPRCLTKILGYELYKVVLNETSQRILDLVYGAEYTNGFGKLVRWNGIVRPEVRISLIANYIYYYYQQSNATQTTGVSTSIAKTDAGRSTSPVEKMVNAWNFYSSEVKLMCDFLLYSENEYLEINGWEVSNTLRISRTINLMSL